MFEIPAGTKVRCIRVGVDWHPSNFKEHVTTERTIFEKHEIVIDPVGKIGCNREHRNVIGGAYACAGWYGFQRENIADLTDMEKKQVGWIILVPGGDVNYLD